MKNKECNIIRDLLPSYIENLTSDDTNTYIENHIKECSDCSTAIKNMKTDINIKKDDKKSKDFVDFAKKYNKKFKHMKFFIIFILLLVIITFTVSTTRKYLILSNCYEKLYNVREANNYHYRIDGYSEDAIYSQEIYRKDDKYLYICSVYDKNNHKVIYPMDMILYYDGQKTYWYSEDDVSNTKVYFTTDYNKFEDLLVPEKQNFSEILLRSIFSRINTEIVNGKECYRIIPSSIVNSEKFSFGNNIQYIDKDTGIPLRSISTNASNTYNGMSEHSIEFNTVTDEDLVVPNVEEYKQIEIIPDEELESRDEIN